jgi:hypothetical protein
MVVDPVEHVNHFFAGVIIQLQGKRGQSNAGQ